MIRCDDKTPQREIVDDGVDLSPLYNKSVLMTRTTQNIDNEWLEKTRVIKKFRLFDDTFFNVCMKGSNEAVQYILRIILGMPELIVEDVRTQEMEPALTERAVILDILATDAKGRKFNIELQRSSSGASPERTRYIRSRIDSVSLKKGQDVKELPDLYVIFITEEDYFEKNRPVYRFRMMDTLDYDELNDRTEVVYVNGSWDEDDEIGRLMHDFRVSDPAQMHPGILRERVEFFKNKDKEGEIQMCDLMEEYVRKRCYAEIAAREEAQQEVSVLKRKLVRLLLESGKSLKEVAQEVDLSIGQVQELADRIDK